MATSRASRSKKVLLFAGDDYEDLELQYPRLRLLEAGMTPVLAGLKAGQHVTGKHGYPAVTDAAAQALTAASFAALIVPGGWMPDKLRRDPDVLRLVREFDHKQKPVASICHGGWICISAGIVKGRRYTGSLGIKDDLVNAGAHFEDAEVVVDGHHVSSRTPDDLPAFMAAVLKLLE
jgi:protease I